MEAVDIEPGAGDDADARDRDQASGPGTALFTAEPIPARPGSTAPRIAAVSGATVIAMPRPMSKIPGRTCDQ